MRKQTIPKSVIISGVVLVLLLLALQFYHVQQLQTSINTLDNNLNVKIDQNTFALQTQMIQDVTSLQSLLTEDIMTLERAQSKSLDQIELIKQQLTTQQVDQDNKLGDIRKELGSIQAKSGDLSTLVATVVKSVVSVRTNSGSGSGVFIASDGTIVTNNHVIAQATAAVIVTYDKKTHPVRLIGRDPMNDIAVLTIDSDEYEYLRWADSDDVKVGEQVIAIGNPRGLDFSVTEGIISAVRNLDGRDVIQIDVPINPGNSGGPLINTDGDIIGINTFKIAASEGLGFAIPSNTVAEVSSTLRRGK